MGKISKNFTSEELTKSFTAERKGIVNIPNEEQLDNLIALVIEVLQPLRDLYQEPFKINSGFRCKELNKVVGGAKNSQHLEGKAVDISVKNPRRLLDTLIWSGLEFDQAILYETFLHISYNEGKNRNQIIRTTGL